MKLTCCSNRQLFNLFKIWNKRRSGLQKGGLFERTQYKGGFIARHYGQYLMERDKIAVQIEINQDLFLLSGKTVLDNEKIASTRERVLAALAGIFLI